MAEHPRANRITTESELFRLLVENIKDYAVFVVDPEGLVRSWNPGAERLLGYSENEIIGQPAALFSIPENLQGGVTQREMSNAVETGRGEDERWHVRKDGSRFWSGGTITPLWDEERNLLGFAKIMRDRTAQKRSDDSLKDALSYAQGVVDTVREPLLVLGADLRVKTANRSFYQIFQASPVETEGRLIYHLGDHLWNIPRLRTLLEEILPQHTSFDGFEVEHEFGSIGHKFMRLNARRFVQEGNQTELILLAIEDVTEGRQAEEERREIETRFTSLVRNVKDHAILTTDRAGRITSWNVEAERIMGYGEAEIFGQPFLVIFTPEDIQDGIPGLELRKARDAGRAVDERWHIRKDGERFWALGIVTPTHDASGRHTGFSKILRDMTEQKLAEESLLRTHEDTEAQVRERTAELRTAKEGLQKEIAERRRTEDAVHQSEARKAAILDSSLDAIVTIDHDGRVVEFSQAAEGIFGYLRADMIGKKLDEMILPPRLREQHRQGLAHYHATGEGSFLGKRLELSAIRADGSEFPVEIVIVRIPGPGQPMFTGFIRDITERKTAECRLNAQHVTTMALAESPSLAAAFPTILESICTCLQWSWTAVWMADSQSKELRMTQFWRSPAANVDEFLTVCLKKTFAHGEGLLGRVWAAGEPTWAPDVTQDENFHREQAAAECGLHGAVAFPIMCGRQVLGVIEFLSHHIEQPDKQFLAMMTVIGSQIGQFIEKKRVEEGLRLFRALIDRTMDVIEVIDPETGRFIDVNETACAVHGYSREEYLSLRVPDIDPSAGSIPWEELIEGHKQIGSQTFESEHRRKDGSTFPVEASLNFIRLGRDYVVAVVRDITERKQLEDQYRQAQKMEAFGQLAGGVAHDFNNLLTIISGYSELVLETLKPEDRNREMLQEIHKAGERAALLTRQLLAFSRKQVVQPQVLDLNGLVASTERMLGRLIGEDVNLTTVLQPGLDRVKVDPGQVEQIIMNLVVNARDAMPQGGRITIETANVDLDESYGQSNAEVKPGRYVLLAVSDTGQGMTEEVKEHVFEPFFTTKEVGKGTGLGLATVFGIVKQSGGLVRAYSEFGHGTTFKIYLPVAEAVALPSQTEEKLATALTGAETILLVEDEKAVRTITQLALQTSGYTLVEAANGEEAIRICEQHRGPIHLLVSDVVMPQMGGRQLAERLTALHPEMRVLFVSGYTDDAVVRHGILQAEVAFLQKPFTMAALQRKVRAVLDDVG